MDKRIEDAIRGRAKQFFTYTIPFLGLAGAAQATIPLVFDQQSDFLWMMNTYDADVAAAAHSYSTRDYPLVNVLITPTSTAQYMAAAGANPTLGAPVPAIFGNGESPFILPEYMYITRGTTLSFQCTNRTAATTYNLYLNLVGFKVM